MTASSKAYTSLLPVAAGLAITHGCVESTGLWNAGTMNRPSEQFVGYESNNLTGNAPWTVLQRLQALYEIKSPGKVFLFVNEQIATLLIDANSVIHEHFDCSRLTLDLREDPDAGSPILVLSIHSKLNWQESENRLDAFDQAWWLHQKWIPSSKRICIDVFSV